MMATYRTPADSQALGPAIRILLKRVMSDPALSAASQKVMSWLLLEGRDEAPGPADMARFVGLTERSVRRVYRELKETGWLDPERGWSEAPKADTPEREAMLDGTPERTEMSATLDFPSFREHIAMLELIRDRALAKGDDRTALSAQVRIGRAMGFDRPKSDRNVRTPLSPPSATAGGARKDRDWGGGGNALIDSAIPSPPPPRPSPALTPDGGRHELATNGAEPAPAGSPLALSGSNWLELADLGRAEFAPQAEKLNTISHLLEKPISTAEKDWLATRDEPSRRPYWLNGVSLTALAGGQNCPRPYQASVSETLPMGPKSAVIRSPALAG